jgi:hypothetical protein
MAFAAKRRVVVNAGRRRRRTNARRKLSAKQIRFFGTPAQKAALKNSRKRKRNASARTTMRRARKTFGTRHRRRTRAKNPGDILSLTLNPGKGRTMARARRRSSGRRRNYRRRRAVSNPRRRRYSMRHHHRTNPRRRNYTHHRRRHHNRRNPSSRGMGMSLKQGIMFTVGAGVGYFGSKALTQAVMGSNNTGVSGYLGNALTTAGLAVAAHMFRGVLGPSAGIAVASGGLLQLVARIISDNTPLGSTLQSLGLGDYQVQNFVTPQRLVDPLNSAQIEIPSGWGAPPPVAIQTAAAPGAPMPAAGAGMHGYNTQGFGRSLYSSAGLYS